MVCAVGPEKTRAVYDAGNYSHHRCSAAVDFGTGLESAFAVSEVTVSAVAAVW